MRMPGYEEVKRVLDGRVKQLGVSLGYARDEVQMKNVPSSLLCKEYGEKNLFIPGSRQFCEERLSYLMRCSNAADATVLLKPAHRKNLVALQREIAALRVCLDIPD